jgi:type IV pilus assembly protein PilV
MTHRLPKRTDSGFTLVELLLALAILSIGLLGLAALQVASQSQGTGGRMRGSAALMAHSILDQIQAEGALTAAERSEYGSVISTGHIYVDPVGATPSTVTTPAGPQYTILGLLPTDPYYLEAAHNKEDKTPVFTVSWRRNVGLINPFARSGFQEFIVNVSWNESGNTATPITRTLSVSRYVRI